MQDGHGRHPGPAPAPAPRLFLTTALCAVGLACVMFDQTSLVVAIATIGRDLDADIAGLQWLSAIMPLVAASTMPTSGILAAHYGARNALRAGLVVFAVGAAGAALSTSLTMLVVARVVEGFGTALILPNGPAVLGSNVPAGSRQRAVGYWLMLSSSGLILGPLAGGVLIQEFGWRVTFVALVPLTLMGAAAISLLKDTARSRVGTFDIAGMSTVCLALAALSWSLIETGRADTPAAIILAGYLTSACLLYAFVRIERRAVMPVMNLQVLGSSLLRTLLPAALTYNAVINGSAFVLSIHFQEGRKFSAALTGLLLLIANLGMPLAGPLTTWLTRRARAGTLMMGSLVALIVAYLALGLGDSLPVAALLLPLLMFGLAAGVLYSVDTVAVLEATDGPDVAPALAALALMRQVGSVIGIAALASLGRLAVSMGVAEQSEQAALILAGVMLAALAVKLAPRLDRLGG